MFIYYYDDYEVDACADADYAGQCDGDGDGGDSCGDTCVYDEGDADDYQVYCYDGADYYDEGCVDSCMIVVIVIMMVMPIMMMLLAMTVCVSVLFLLPVL